MRAVFHRDRDVPYEKSLRMHRSRGPLIQRKALFFGYLSFAALDEKVTRRFSGGSFGFDLDLDLRREKRRETIAAMSRLAPLLPRRKPAVSTDGEGSVF